MIWSVAAAEKEGDGYKWNQSESTVDISVVLPEDQGTV
jgi:hypothetical protein